MDIAKNDSFFASFLVLNNLFFDRILSRPSGKFCRQYRRLNSKLDIPHFPLQVSDLTRLSKLFRLSYLLRCFLI